MKELHVITVGISIVTNAMSSKVGGLTGNEDIGNDSFWRDKRQDAKFISELVGWVKEDPKKSSAELNSLFSFLEERKNTSKGEIFVYLISTETGAGEICKYVLEKVLKEWGFKILTGKEISGYFREASYDEKYARDAFTKDVSAMLDSLIGLTQEKMKEGYRIYFNATGGLKAHVIACALAGFVTGCQVYYMHENFKKVVILPPLLYLPRGREVELLEILSDKEPRSGKEFERLKGKFDQEIKRLEIYELITVERDEKTGKEYRVKITNKGKYMLEELKKMTNNSGTEKES